MDDLRWRTLYFSGLVVAVMLAFAVVFDYGMGVYEGRPITFLDALQFVVETFTTTGYGAYAPWDTPEMTAFVILMDLTGTVLIFLALPVVFFPLFQEALATTIPRSADASDHVVVATHTPRADALIAELQSQGVEYLIVEPDRDRAEELYDEGYAVINADPDSTEGLAAAELHDARALVADVSDQVDASIVLTAKEMAPDVRVVSVLENPQWAGYHELAGADVVLSPRSLLGASLARKVTTRLSTDLGDAIEVGEDFDIVEIPVPRESDLVGKTLTESGLRERTGVNVIGAWFQGVFESPPPPDAVIDRGTVLLVTGRPDSIRELAAPIRSGARRGRGEVVVVGHGRVGQTVTNRLAEAGLPYTVVDVEDGPGVDVVGDATDADVLKSAGVESASTVILALPDDTTTEFATLVVRDLTQEVEVIARAEEPESITTTYRAGADYVLSLATVSGRMTASAVLEGEDVLSPDSQVEVLKTRAPGLVGKSLGGAEVRSRTGCTVVAVERDGAVFTDVGPDFRVRDGDELIIAGTDKGTNRFVELLTGD